jgi:hypothetical protein
MTTPVIALLGRKDEPTDAVEEYCRYLGVALRAHDIGLDIRRVPWEVHGWPDAFQALQLQATEWRDTWVLAILGHSEIGMTMRYVKIAEHYKVEAVVKLEKY